MLNIRYNPYSWLEKDAFFSHIFQAMCEPEGRTERNFYITLPVFATISVWHWPHGAAGAEGEGGGGGRERGRSASSVYGPFSAYAHSDEKQTDTRLKYIYKLFSNSGTTKGKRCWKLFLEHIKPLTFRASTWATLLRTLPTMRCVFDLHR